MIKRILLRKSLICLGLPVLFLVYPCRGSVPTVNKGPEQSALSVSAPAAKAHRQRYNMWNGYAGALYLSGGFSKEFKYESVVGGKMVLDYLLTEKVSVGAQASLYRQSKADGQAKTPYLGARLSYHFTEAGWRPRQNHWNIYAGVSAEIEMGGGSKDWHEKSLVGDLHLGLRYRVGQRWFIWAEAAINNVTGGLTFAL